MSLIPNSDHTDLHNETSVPPDPSRALDLPEPDPSDELVIETDLTPAEGFRRPPSGEIGLEEDDSAESSAAPARKDKHWEQNTDVVGPGSAPATQLAGGMAGTQGQTASSTSTRKAAGALPNIATGLSQETEILESETSEKKISLADTAPPVERSGVKMAPASMRERLSERFELLELLGEGGMGQVYHARDLRLGEEIAVKMLRSHGASNAEDVGRFKREIIAARRITHPNVIRIHDFGETEEETFISMELLRGGSLDEIIAKGPVPILDAVRIISGIADGLAAAHEQDIIHRDIKPQNILFTQGGVPKLVDFGIARLATQDSTQTVGGFRGTPYYMSPEQADGREVTHLSDVYSLGVVMFELFTGQRPFESDSLAKLALMHVKEKPPRPRSIRSDIPRRIEYIILRALDKRPERRYESIEALAKELRHVLARLASGRSAGPVPGQTRRIVGLAAGLLLLIAGSWVASQQVPALRNAVTPQPDGTPTAFVRGTSAPIATPVRTAVSAATSKATPRPTVKRHRVTKADLLAPKGAPGGVVSFNPAPWAEVWVEGVQLSSESPLTVRLKPGTYNVKLIHRSNKPKKTNVHRQRITVRDGAKLNVAPNMVKP